MWRNDKSQTEVASGNFSNGNFSVACGDDDDDDVGNDVDDGGVECGYDDVTQDGDDYGNDDDDDVFGEINRSGMRQ